jgi:hypothetical protein
MLLIGFGSKARHGKDTAAEAIRDYYAAKAANTRAHVPTWKGEVKVGIFKYATVLYAEVNQWLAANPGWAKHSNEVWYSPTASTLFPDWVQPEPNPEISALAPYGKHPKLLQWWGTEYRRNNFGQDYWVKRTFANIPANLDIAIISDVRFPNEAEAVEQRHGYTVNVQRLRKDGSLYTDPSRSAAHPSETALDNWNWNFRIISPDGHQAWTAQQAINLAEYLRQL